MEWANDEKKHHGHKHEEDELKIIIKDSLVIIILGELDDEKLKNTLKSFLDTKGAKVAGN
ncbi:hypothetical protein [Desulfotruncus alcoholivorax]|uniref:hypothetical protein n=1 Tax=Desulfotruncus alcoholivorax TaxID=265477 RepID=UPI0004028E6D|nr:hypothetical protein [Desulfotruncus alcoholivorax]